MNDKEEAVYNLLSSLSMSYTSYTLLSQKRNSIKNENWPAII